jgi:hypothetical protein
LILIFPSGSFRGCCRNDSTKKQNGDEAAIAFVGGIRWD